MRRLVSLSGLVRLGGNSSEAYFPIISAFLLVGVPLLLSPFDFWDGRILSHAIETRQDIGMHSWAFTSGWILQYYILQAAQFIETTVGIIANLQLRLIIICSLCGVVYEAVRFYSDVVRLPKSWVVTGGFAVAAFSSWNVLLSTSVIFIYVMCTWLSLVAIRLIYHHGYARNFLGILLLLASFQLNSNFAFSIALGGGYLATSFIHERHVKRETFLRFLAIFVTSALAFIALKTVFTPSGIYGNYNRISTPTSFSEATTWSINMARYFQYPAIILITLVLGHLLLFLGTRLGGESMKGERGFDRIPKHHYRDLLWPVVLSLFLIGSAAAPYVVVGKSADLKMLLADWNPRHTFLLAMPTGLFLASSAQLLYHWHGLSDRKIFYLPAASAIVLLALLLQAAFWCKFSRAAYEESIMSVLSRHPAPPPGIVKIVAPQLAESGVRYYESNWLLNKVYGKEDWLSAIVFSEEQTGLVPKWLRQGSSSKAYRSQFLMRSFRSECETTIKIEGERFGVLEVVLWLLGVKSLPDNLSLTKREINCDVISPNE